MHPEYEIDYPAVQRYMEDAPGVLEHHLEQAPEALSTSAAQT
jgi:glutaconate CoA-transferase subunit A